MTENATGIFSRINQGYTYKMLLLRKYLPNSTLGKFVLPWTTLCYSLERPWLDNKENVSCIPEGIYLFERDYTGRFKWWKCTHVQGRTDIEIHQGNYIKDSQGCILPCMYLKGEVGYRSVDACNKILDMYGDEGFTLEIREWNESDGEW